MKTKILSLLFAMMLVIGMLASCDNGNTGDNGDGGNDDDVQIPDGAPSYQVTWDRTELKYALTDNNAAGELESGCKKYYAGSIGTGTVEKVDNLVTDRNLAAAKQANVTVRFDYDTVSGGWGGNIETMVTKSLAGSSQSPDMYASFVYDITCAQLRDCFANLLQTGKTNWFRFTEADYQPSSADYFDSKSGEGYFFEYMKSLSLSDDKMFVLASNYCTDLVRSFLVVPMNVEQMSTLVGTDANGVNNSYTGDMMQVSDFYDLVWRTAGKGDKYQEGFTYDVIAHYASKFNGGGDSSDVLSGKNAFAVGTGSGLPAAGLLYTSSVTIISKTSNGDGTYTYDYPTNNPELDQFAVALTNLFENRDGVIAVSGKDAGISGVYNTELLAIRDKFSKGNILFGGVVALGSLDESDYQRMRVEGKQMGFGILPVPLYRSADEYKTLVHNIAKAVAISKTTKNFTQCTAYLDYLSRMSQEVLDEYYEVKLTSAVGGMAAVYNEQMLTYIRNHVRNCFDKTFEDAVAKLIEATDAGAAAAGKYHEIIGDMNFVCPTLSNDYKSYAPAKLAQLNQAVTTWNGFTD